MTPKAEVEYLFDDFTVRQALEKMEYHRYATIPVLDKKTGKYLYSLSEGDLLWTIKDKKLNYADFQKIGISEIKRHRDVAAARIDTSLEELYIATIGQNFVPIIDDLGTFIGLVTRRKVLKAILAESINSSLVDSL